MSTNNPQLRGNAQPNASLDLASSSNPGAVNPEANISDTQIVPASVVNAVRSAERPSKYIVASLSKVDGGILVDVSTNQGATLAKSLSATAEQRSRSDVKGTIVKPYEIRYTVGASILTCQASAIEVNFSRGSTPEASKFVILSAKLQDGSTVNFAALANETANVSSKETQVGTVGETRVEQPAPSSIIIGDKKLYPVHKDTFTALDVFQAGNGIDLLNVESTFRRLLTRSKDFSDKPDFKTKLELLAKRLVDQSDSLAKDFPGKPTLLAVVHECLRKVPLAFRHQLAAPTAFLAKQIVEKGQDGFFGRKGDPDAKVVAPFLKLLNYKHLIK